MALRRKLKATEQYDSYDEDIKKYITKGFGKRIQGDPNKQEPFEMRRLQIIRKLSDVAQWHHITTKQNLADLLARDCTTRTWLKDQLWWQGPDATVAPLVLCLENVSSVRSVSRKLVI